MVALTKAAAPKPLVLVVDDEALIRWSLRERFRAKGYEVVEAETGPEALDVFAAQPVSAVVLDVNLPGLDGLAVLERIKASVPECPVIMMTAFDSPGSAQRAAALGAAHYVIKPFDLDRMLHLVGQTLSTPGNEGAAPV